MLQRQIKMRMDVSRIVIDSVASSISTLASMQSAGFSRERDALQSEISSLESKMTDKTEDEMTQREKILLEGQKRRLSQLKSAAEAQEQASNESMKKMHHLNQAASIAQIGMSHCRRYYARAGYFYREPYSGGHCYGCIDRRRRCTSRRSISATAADIAPRRGKSATTTR